MWELIDLLLGRGAIKNKSILNFKRKADGSIDEYKAWLMANCYTQQDSIDYKQTFLPVARFTPLWLILGTVACLDLKLYKINVKIAFLNWEMDE